MHARRQVDVCTEFGLLYTGVLYDHVIQVCDESLLTSLCHDVMTLVAAEAGGEVARMFEYQLALLLGNVDASSVTLLAEHCAQRALDYAVKVSLSVCLSVCLCVCVPPSLSVSLSYYTRYIECT